MSTSIAVRANRKASCVLARDLGDELSLRDHRTLGQSHPRSVAAQDEKSLAFRRDYDPGLPLIALDRDQMVQAFLNLVSNAATALDGQGTITLKSRAVTTERPYSSRNIRAYAPVAHLEAA